MLAKSYRYEKGFERLIKKYSLIPLSRGELFPAKECLEGLLKAIAIKKASKG